MYVANYKTNEHGNQTVIVAKEGRRWLTVIAMTARSVRVIKVAHDDAQYLTPALRGDKPYPVRRAAQHFRSHAAKRGVTFMPNAKRLLRGV